MRSSLRNRGPSASRQVQLLGVTTNFVSLGNFLFSNTLLWSEYVAVLAAVLQSLQFCLCPMCLYVLATAVAQPPFARTVPLLLRNFQVQSFTAFAQGCPRRATASVLPLDLLLKIASSTHRSHDLHCHRSPDERRLGIMVSQ